MAVLLLARTCSTLPLAKHSLNDKAVENRFAGDLRFEQAGSFSFSQLKPSNLDNGRSQPYPLEENDVTNVEMALELEVESARKELEPSGRREKREPLRRTYEVNPPLREPKTPPKRPTTRPPATHTTRSQKRRSQNTSGNARGRNASRPTGTPLTSSTPAGTPRSPTLTNCDQPSPASATQATSPQKTPSVPCPVTQLPGYRGVAG
ncbi:Protein of unknown function [Gryllus bimaculatus]|nr:Protein of unknown function [Gryllus bimaculatus]